MRGAHVLITGAAQRIGREIALQLAAGGADTVITYLRSRAAAERTAADLASYGVRAWALRCDVREERQIRRTVREAVARLGSLDLLINNAALYETVSVQKMTVRQWDDMFNTNVRGPFLMSRACLPHLQASQGRIINLGSLGGVRPWISHAHYCQSKAALHMQTQLLAKAFAPEVAVNCVAPGMIDVGEHKSSAFMKKLAHRTPMRRNGSAAEVAATVRLVAEMPHVVTGQIFVVDGGLGLV